MTRLFLDLSTAHLSAQTRTFLAEQGVIAAAVRTFADKQPLLHVGATVYGWFVYADERAMDSDEPEPGVPADLWAIMKRARAAGCEYILFDADADTLDGLPTYGLPTYDF